MGLIEDVRLLNSNIEAFTSDPNYEQNVVLLEKYHAYNQKFISGIRERAFAFGTLVKENIETKTMSHKAKKYLKSIQK